MKYDNLRICRLSRESRSRTCGYWFVVTAHWTGPHTAFRTRKSLNMWLENLGLSLAGSLDKAGDHCHILGAYNREYTQPETLEVMEGLRTREMDNGEYTLGVVTTGADGLRTINLAGPNSKRVVFDYRESDTINHANRVEDEEVATA